MTTDKIYEEIRSLRIELHRITGTRLNHEAMAARLGVTKRTLYNRIQNGSVPRPTDGTWLVAEVMEWESLEPA